MPKITSLLSWAGKFFECLYAFIAAAMVCFWCVQTLLSSYFTGYDNEFFIHLFRISSGLFIVLAIVLSIWWQVKEKHVNFNTGIKHAWLRGTMRYFLAFDVSIYGFGKIFRTQFAHIYARQDMRIGSLSGFELTWNYFGYSHTFAVILGLCQITGAILLLFRRTCLAGVCVLVPVMVNIVLIDIFYNIDAGALINAIFILCGLVYLFLLRWQAIKALFLTDGSGLPAVRLSFFKPLLRLLAIGAAFGIIYSYVANRQPAIFAGKWVVQQFTHNGEVINPADWKQNPGIWRDIYIEESGMFSSSNNPDVFDPKSATDVRYSYDIQRHTLSLTFEPYTLDIVVSKYDGQNMQWNATTGRDTLMMKLAKKEQ